MNKMTGQVDAILKAHNHDPANLVMIMQDIQTSFGYLPAPCIELIAGKLRLPGSQVYSVATFYKSFSLKPRGKHKLEICEGTACHIRGASQLMSRISDELGIKAGETTADGEITLESVHCIGACALGPVAVIDGAYFGNLTASRLLTEIKKCSGDEKCACDQSDRVLQPDEKLPEITERIDSAEKYKQWQARLREEYPLDQPRLLVCADTGCLAKGSLELAGALSRELAACGLNRPVNLALKKVGCQGMCEQGPLVMLHPENILYTRVSPEDAPLLIRETVLEKRVVDRLLYRGAGEEAGIEKYHLIPFYALQKRIALRNVGFINPLDIKEYIAREGYSSLLKALYSMEPDRVIDEIEKSGLRGRGGGGFPTGKKWRSAARVNSDPRFVICNGDEGDPGAFMDRSIMEGDPHSVIEGMVICAYAIRASRGYIYVRAEYPRALKNLQTAIDQARRAGFLGANICGSSFSFDIQINRGAGAFVCGESTALMQSVEGKTGEPRAKYIRSAERGLFDQPTVLNNVETFVNIPVIIGAGASDFAAVGTAGSTGTKAFSVVGKVKNTGLVEVPMGTTLKAIIYDICGGILEDKPFKAVQTGGPSGGCLPAGKLDLPVDFDSLTREGSMMGSGGMIVMDEGTCMVDVARYFTDFLTRESCGKCAACRLGLEALQEILTRICAGGGEAGDIEKIEKLLFILGNASLCGLGKSAPNPVKSTMTHFKDEYLAHIIDKRCPAGVCRALISYEINDLCTGCRLCVKACPRQAISGARRERHRIDRDLCDRCGLCKATCKFNAIAVR
jgi:NADH-quinone oxidoreductase subunit F